MDEELIGRLAREAGMPYMPHTGEQTIFCISLEQQAAFAALVAEECAKVCDELNGNRYHDCAGQCAVDIRAKFPLPPT